MMPPYIFNPKIQMKSNHNPLFPPDNPKPRQLPDSLLIIKYSHEEKESGSP
jgi:hypothetical protein